MHKLHAAICNACVVHNRLPSNETSSVRGESLRSFYTRAENMIFISPRLSDGTRAAYIVSEDVCLTVTNADAQLLCVRVHVHLDPESGNITITYTLDSDTVIVPAKIHVRVHVCGVLLVDVSVHRAFSGRTDGRLQSRHSPNSPLPCKHIAIHSTGVYLVVSDYIGCCVNVFTLPDFQFVRKLGGKKGIGSTELSLPCGLCFTSAGTLLVADYFNDRVQHWTLDGEWVASYPVQRPSCIALCGNAIAVGRYERGVHVLSLKSGAVLSKWLNGNSILGMTAVSATALAVSTRGAKTIDLYTLEGMLKRRLAVGIDPYGLAMCVDGCLLVSDWNQKRIRVFSMDGVEIVTSPFVSHTFEGIIGEVVSHADHVYVLEWGVAEHRCRIHVFE